jgi:hypothetical protein
MSIEKSWRADWDADGLHISGMTDLFPNDFSTASLHRDDALDDPDTVGYRLVFYRDKEPFCDRNLVGPVHHWEPSVLPGVLRIRIVFPDGRGGVELAVPRRPQGGSPLPDMRRS